MALDQRIGSVFAALAWLAVSSLFSWYLGNFANYNATCGALEGHRWADADLGSH